MLEKRITTNGHIYAKLSSLMQWDKNPRDIYENQITTLRILIVTLGLFKPLFVTSDGVMVGGNMRLPQIQWLNENEFEWTDDKGTHKVDVRGNYDEVPIVELSFAEVESEPGKFRAMLDGVVQYKVFDSIEQGLIEYATADNMSAGYYDQQKASELFLEHKDSIDMKTYQLNLAPPVSMKTFVDQYSSNDGPHLSEDKKQNKSKEINIVIKYTPQQFQEVEPKIEKIKADMGIENISDLFTALLDQAVYDVDNRGGAGGGIEAVEPTIEANGEIQSDQTTNEQEATQ